ncbi:MAG TPA: FAD:protein FMN transferase [Ktedonobacteraceae bacterium]|nr:FAD:protein FMN transferase [Ktedonobacteraceae bacterium]
MGTTISLLLPEAQAEEGLTLVRALFEEWEQSLSRFLPDSELTRLNELAGTSLAMPVSNLFYKVLSTALTAARATRGIYDPALLDQLIQAGYDRTFEELPRQRFAPIIPGEPGGRWRGIRIDPIRHRVSLPDGVGLDFGGIAKGMAVDASLNLLRRQGITTALVNAGGDLAVLGKLPEMESWPVAVPGREGTWTIPLNHGAMATSGIARRNWIQGQTFRHHLLDPRTGEPVENDLWSVTVAADRCEQAEVAAKVAFILGSEKGADFLWQHRLAGLLVRENGTWEAVHPWPIENMECER